MVADQAGTVARPPRVQRGQPLRIEQANQIPHRVLIRGHQPRARRHQRARRRCHDDHRRAHTDRPRASLATQSAAGAGSPHRSAAAPAPAQPSRLPAPDLPLQQQVWEPPLRRVSRPGDRSWSAHWAMSSAMSICPLATRRARPTGWPRDRRCASPRQRPTTSVAPKRGEPCVPTSPRAPRLTTGTAMPPAPPPSILSRDGACCHRPVGPKRSVLITRGSWPSRTSAPATASTNGVGPHA